MKDIRKYLFLVVLGILMICCGCVLNKKEIASTRNIVSFDRLFKKEKEYVLRLPEIPENGVKPTKYVFCGINSKGEFVMMEPRGGFVFSQDGKLLTTLGTKGKKLGQFIYAAKPTIGPADKIYISDTGTNRISIFNAKGELIDYFNPIAGYIPLSPLVVDKKGNIYISGSMKEDEKYYTISKYDSAFEYISSFCTISEKEARKAGSVNTFIALSKNAYIYAIQNGSYNIKKYSLEGALIEEFGDAPKWYVSPPETLPQAFTDTTIMKTLTSAQSDSISNLWISSWTLTIDLEIALDKFIIVEYGNFITGKFFYQIYTTKGKSLIGTDKTSQYYLLTTDKEGFIYFLDWDYMNTDERGYKIIKCSLNL
ncbi:MAG: hypothetical protein WC614_13945 [bacterium]